MNKKAYSIFSLLLMLLIFVMVFELPNAKADTSPSTVATSSNHGISSQPMQKNMIYVNGTGYMFYFYASATALSYKRANVYDNPALWTYMGSFVQVSTTYFSVDFDDYNRIVFFTYCSAQYVYYLRGDYSAGNITWNAIRTVYTGASPIYYCRVPDIAFDGLNEKVVIAYDYMFDGTRSTVRISQSTDYNGTSWSWSEFISSPQGYIKFIQLERDTTTANIMLIFNRGYNLDDVPYSRNYIASKCYVVTSETWYPLGTNNWYSVSFRGMTGDLPNSEINQCWKLTYYNGIFRIVYQAYDDAGYAPIKYRKFNYENTSWYGTEYLISHSYNENTGLVVFGNSTGDYCVFTNASENNINYVFRSGSNPWGSRNIWLSETNLEESSMKSYFQRLSSDVISTIYLSWETTTHIQRQAIFGNPSGETGGLISVSSSPEISADFWVDSISYTTPQNFSLLFGQSYNFTAENIVLFESNHYLFDHWTFNGISYYSRTTVILISEVTTVVIYYSFQLNEILINIESDSRALSYYVKVIINGTSFSDNSVAYLLNGTYNLSCSFSEYYNFTNWQVEGSITIEDDESQNTLLTVNGDGTLTLYLQDNSPYIWWFERTNAWIGICAGFGIIFLPLLGVILVRREDELIDKIKIIFICFMASLILSALFISWVFL